MVIITGFLTILGIIAAGVYYLRGTFKEHAKLSQELKEKRRLRSREEDFKGATVFIANMAILLSTKEGKPLSNRHLREARAFYEENIGLLGMETAEFTGLYTNAKRYIKSLHK